MMRAARKIYLRKRGFTYVFWVEGVLKFGIPAGLIIPLSIEAFHYFDGNIDVPRLTLSVGLGLVLGAFVGGPLIARLVWREATAVNGDRPASEESD
jgi:hypothetical protein